MGPTAWTRKFEFFVAKIKTSPRRVGMGLVIALRLRSNPRCGAPITADAPEA